jgi:riboflavin kinase/FMN adenylyltransferase
MSRALTLIEGWETVPEPCRHSSFAIGNFDGVHRGHQAVLARAIDYARAQGCAAGVMVFEPHPRKFFQPEKPFFRLTSLERKLALFERAGLDFAAVLPFDARLASLGAEQFVEAVIVEGFAAAHVVTGASFFFGKGRDGNPAVLKALGERHGFAVSTVAPVGDSGEIFSSTRIRELLAEGDVKSAGEMLGHWWRVSGVVQSGAGRGTGLGYPTANIALDEGQSLKHGIYAVWVYHAGQRYAGAAYLGTRPTFDAGAPVLEIFLLDFSGNLYGARIEVEFIAFVRGDAKFKSAEALIEQMNRDCARSREILMQPSAQQPPAADLRP